MPAPGYAIALKHKDEILRRMALGQPITTIAHDLGYADHSGIIHRLGEDKDYQAALRAGLVGKLEHREKELENADTNITVTRADRLLGHARWWAERLDPQRFGAVQKLTGADGGPITVELVSFASTQIEGQVVEQPIAPAHSIAALPNK